ncbi:MAG: penicillin-binding protein 1C [Bacteroidota bacterium]
MRQRVALFLRSLRQFLKSKRGRRRLIFISLLSWFIFCIPSELFEDPTSTVLEDQDGKLLCAQIADDGQWRFPHNPNVPDKFVQCLIQFEDRSFYNHLGVNPLAVGRALMQNISSGKKVSGGSTITMQLVRIMRKNKPRTFYQKTVEMILATRVELSYSKKEILALYASNAPFGSNVVGLDAASWRYFGRSPDKLSWAESATLAVLPNAPSLMHPGKNRDKLLAKRNRLLDRLLEAGIIDRSTCEISKEEPLPEKPYPLPQHAPHLLTRAVKEGLKGQRVRTTLKLDLQLRVNELVELHHQQLKANEIHNAAALVLDVQTGNVLAYTGNTENSDPQHGSDVDVIAAPRSTGSILKPLLFARMLSEGELLSTQLVADIPTQIGGYSPKNYYLTYDGAVPAKKALARSLNIPIVKLLQQHGVEKFHYLLNKIGMTTVTNPAEHYGLSLILGGAEGKLWDIAGIYASMARTLNNYTAYNGKYNQADFHPPYYRPGSNASSQVLEETSWFDAAAIYQTFEAMVEVSRPDEENSWREFASSVKIAWKTGTSFGFRDGWAIGVTPRYVVAVWTGNADGEGRPGLIGVKTAAPLMFGIFNALRPSGWFDRPYDEMTRALVCRQSGFRAIDICEHTDTVWIQSTGVNAPPCPYHRLVHLDASGQYRVSSDCENVSAMKNVSWFVLPPAMEWYYKSKNANYRELPPWRKGCSASSGIGSMELIYPKQLSKIYVPRELDGTRSKTVFEVAHREKGLTIYWHLDEDFIGQTKDLHQMGLNPPAGIHTLTLVDENGETLTQQFEIIDKE